MTGSFAIASYPIASGATVTVSTIDTVVPVTVSVSGCNGTTTARDVIQRALKAILVEGADSPLEADEYQDGLDSLNSYLLDLEANGVRLGFNKCCSLSDTVTIPDGAMAGLVANLAIDISPMYGGHVTSALAERARTGRSTLYRLGVNVGNSSMPLTLPGAYHYAANTYAAMTMAGNRKGTQLASASQALKVQGVWQVQDFHGLVPDIGGRITNKGEGRTVTVYAEFNLKSGSTTSGGVLAVVRNQSIELYTENLALSTTPVSALIQGTIAMEAGDYLEIYVSDTNGAPEITIIDALVKLS